MSPADRLKSWLAGYSMQRYVYHEGFLMRDRKGNSELDALARAVWAAYATGRLTLVQRKMGAGAWQYIAIKRRMK